MNNESVVLNIDIDGIMKMLPHRYPLLLVDRIVSLVPFKDINCQDNPDTSVLDKKDKKNGEVVAYKNVTINEQIFLGHFPKEPIYPGVMIIEGMAQAGGILAFISTWGMDFSISENKIVYFMTIDNVKFRIPVRPGDRLEYRLSVSTKKKNIWKFRGEAFVDSRLACQADLMAMVTDRHT